MAKLVDSTAPYPNIKPTRTKEQVADICAKQREISKRGLAGQYENSDSCWRFYNSDQSTYADQIQFLDTWGRRKRAMVTFNDIQKNVDSVVGFFAQNRRQAKFIARLNQNAGQQLYSKNMNALYDYHRENTNSDQLESEQDLDMMVCGYGAIDTDLTYMAGNATTMPNGEIAKRKIDSQCFYWDPAAKRKNLIDARWMGYYEDYELRDALMLYQNSQIENFEQVAEDDPDTGYVFNPYGGIYDKIKLMNTVEWTAKEQEMVRVYNHQWMEYETFYKADNPLYLTDDVMTAMFIKMKLDDIAAQIKPIGDTISTDVFEFDPLARELTCDEKTYRLLKKELSIEGVAFKRKVFYGAVVSGKHVFSWFKLITQQGFSIKAKTGVYNKHKKIWVGMVNPMMEPASYKNKALTELMFTIASNSKGGVMVEEDAVEDVADFEQKFAKTDAVIVVNNGALSQGKIQEKAKPAIPTGLENIITLSEANVAANGVDPAFLGEIGSKDESGVMYKRRVRQVIGKFGNYNDSITLYQKEDARLHGDLIPIWVENNQGAVVRIVGEDGADDFIQLTQDMLAPEYDVSIQEAAQSVDEKLETAAMLSQAGFNLLTAGAAPQGIAFINESLQFYRLDGDVRSRLSQALQPQQDPAIAQLQQQLAELQKYIESGQVEKTQSETQKNMATAMKTMKDAGVSEVTVPKVKAETVKLLREADRTVVESVVAAREPRNEVNVNV